jgi:hypothetical protein
MRIKLPTRTVVTLAALAYIVLVGYLFTVVPLQVFNVLLVTVVVPMVWLIAAFARWSAHQHANRWSRDIAKVHGGRPVRLPERAR